MAITEITYDEFNNGDTGVVIRNKLNLLGNSVATLSTETSALESSIPVENTLKIGFADYNDLTTLTTPIAIPNNDTYVDITNDGAGLYSTNMLPDGVTDVWDAATQRFDFSELSVGDMLDIRLDVTVTTTAPTQTVTIDLELGGIGNEFTVLFNQNSFKLAGEHRLNRFNGLYIGSEDVRTNGAKFIIRSDDDATLVVNGWYVKVIKL